MRLISQYGEIDIPYERMAVEIDGSDGQYTIIAYDTSDNDEYSYWAMGAYDTLEKAKKVMWEIGESQYEDMAYFLFPKNEDVI